MRTDLQSLLTSIKNGPLGANITAWKRLPAQEPEYAPWPQALSPALRAAYEDRGITQLYSHQAEVYDRVTSGRDVVVTTPTASGKTLCYNLPVLDAILKDPSSRAIYLFPTKALGQDQVAELQEIIPLLRSSVNAYAYDGDTPGDVRRAVRNKAHIVVTNPDMLHAGILPHHTKWMGLFRNLNYIVIDELHAYRGVFGSHVANVIRRLRRIASFYGSSPRFILSSATIANPRELAARVIGSPVDLIDHSGAPRGDKVLAFYNPPVIQEELGIRRSYIPEAVHFASLFLNSSIMTIVFARARMTTEVLLTEIRRRVEKTPAETGLVRGYRGGYLPKQRREIERGLREGTVRGVVSTNALELGVDIGRLDVAVLAGYPGTINSTWQQAGRAGRRSGLSAAILVASSAPLDQYVVRNPDYFFGSSPEHGLIDPENLLILLSHVKCAAFELPFEDRERLGDTDTSEMLEYLEQEGVLRHAGGKWHWTADNYPADHISLRSVSSDNFIVVDRTASTSRVIGEVDFTSAPTIIHEKAIYIHEGTQYYVDELDFEERRAYVSKVAIDYFTDAITYTKVRVIESFDERPSGPVSVEHGEVLVFTQVVGFKKIKFHTLENIGSGEVNLPENQMHTMSYWFTIPSSLIASLPYPRDMLVDGLLGIIYALHNVAAVHLMCDPRDLGATLGDRQGSFSVEQTMAGVRRIPTDEGAMPEDFEPVLFLYDNLPGGVGFSEGLFKAHEELMMRTLSLIRACPCVNGCPSCVGPVNFVGRESKRIARSLLDLLIHESAAPTS
ncbi:DEAD/DEAH box helicase [Candidatus Fermentibacteria bacterium]|nr:DEAD/DEAH box helicase [Candidatus Fermentibacteria bacterium]